MKRMSWRYVLLVTQNIFMESEKVSTVLLQVRMFMKPNRETRTRTLGEIINERMTEKKTEIQSQFSDGTELIKVDTHLIFGILWNERLKVD